MKRISVLVIGLVLASVGGVTSAHGQANGSAAVRSAAVNTLQPGDLVRITIWPESQLGGEFTVEQSGNVYLPVLGEVRVVDSSMDALRIQLRERYREYINNAVVTVTPAFTVGVLGEVQRPGRYVITPTDGLFDVIGMAGGFRATANEEKVRVVREGEVVQINALRALRSGTGLDALTLRSGDQIIVESRRGLGWDRMRDVLALFQSVALIITLVERFQ